jgi:hypothetical protein
VALTAKWLKTAQNAVNDDPAFRALGSIDVNMGFKVGSAAFLVTFGGFSCHDVRKIRVAELRDADFVVEMSQKQWDAFLKGRTSGKGVTLAELDNVDGVIKAINPRKNLDFLRYHLSVQAFIDAGAGAEAGARAA